MSSSADSIASSFPSGFSITGGLPTKTPDLAASIVFLVAFLLLVPLALWRWLRRDTRSMVLLRPSLVITVRIATYVVRALQANGNYSSTLFTLEQIFLLIGLVPLVEPIVSLLRAHVRRNWIPVPPAQQGEQQKEVTLLSRVLRLLQLLVLVAVILGITAGSKASDARTNPDDAASLKTYRYAVLSITLGILGVSTTVNLFVHFKEGLPARGTLYLLVCAAILVIPNVYKLVSSLKPPSPISHGAKAAFYLLSALPEWIVTAIYFSVDLNALFGVRESNWKDKVEKAMKKGKWPVGLGYVGQEEFKRTKGHAMVPSSQYREAASYPPTALSSPSAYEKV